MKRLLKIGKMILISMVSFLVLFFGLVLYFHIIRWNDVTLQKAHMAEIQSLYADGSLRVEEQTFVSFDIEEENLLFNEIRMIASHNSYKKFGSPIGKALIALFENQQEADALKYTNPPITDQLMAGIRSFELDVRYRKGQFETTHVPLVDNSSTMPLLALGFEEIALWSQHNPNHIPIVILLELKSDWEMLDPTLERLTLDHLALLETLAQEVFGDTLFQPRDVIQGKATMQEALRDEGWPTLQSMLGKVIVVLHAGSLATAYAESDSTLQTKALFPSVYATDSEQVYASFVIHNQPNVEAIQALVSKGLIVRTRMDSELVFQQSEVDQAWASGAQLLTTDFHPAHQFKTTPYDQLLPSGFYIEPNPFLNEEE